MRFLTIPLILVVWEVLGRIFAVKTYILPLPGVIFTTIIQDFGILTHSAVITGYITLIALVLSVILASILAVLFYFYKPFARLSQPIITVMQVTPLVAIIPLLMLYFSANLATIFAAVIIAFIPLLVALNANLAHENVDFDGIFKIYQASPTQRFHLLKMPQATIRLAEMLPLTANLALIGTVVGEFTTSFSGGLAMLLLESQYRLNSPRLFACLFMIIALGFCLQFVMQRISKCLNR